LPHALAGPSVTTSEVFRALEETAAAATQAAQQALTYAELLDEALAILAAERAVHPPSAPRPSRAAEVSHLTPRERDVLALVARGLTNKAIAEALFVSPNTVKTHVGALLRKLDVESRVQLATLAALPDLHPASSVTQPASH